MSNEKENEMVDSNFDDYDDFWSEREKHNIDHVPVDVRQYVISLGQAGIHGPGSVLTRRLKFVDHLGLTSVRESLGIGEGDDTKGVLSDRKWLQNNNLQLSGDLLQF